MNENLESLTVAGLQLKMNRPVGLAVPPVTLMLHGWTGDENSMWVFTRELPVNQQIVTPRAIFPSTHPKFGGYSWTDHHEGEWSNIKDFDNAVERVEQLLLGLSRISEADYSQINLVGFSQGAALAYAFVLRHLQRVKRLACLSGFMPEGSEQLKVDLKGLPVFIAHGSADDIVPVEKAEQARQFFVEAGAEVTFCLSDIGHRMDADCYKGFAHFMS